MQSGSTGTPACASNGANVVIAARRLETGDVVAGSAEAHDYLRQRLSLSQWGLRTPAGTARVLERATTWSEDPEWQRFTSRIGDTYRALEAGMAPPERELDPTATDVTRRSLATMRVMSAVLAGRGDAAAHDAFAAPLQVPMDDADVGAVAVLGLAALESGVGWPELEASMSRIVREGVRANDDGATGSAALTLAQLQFLRGRYRDAARWLAEAKVHARRRDPIGEAAQPRPITGRCAADPIIGDRDDERPVTLGGTEHHLRCVGVLDRVGEPLAGDEIRCGLHAGWQLCGRRPYLDRDRRSPGQLPERGRESGLQLSGRQAACELT